jgi:hypothetical protein
MTGFMNKKLTIEFVRAEFKKENYTLLSNECRDSKQKLSYICPNGHKHSIVWNAWQRGHRCPYCIGVGKPSIEFIRSEFEKEGYILLTKEYKNNSQKLCYVCPVGHRHSISWHNWQVGKRCPYCAKRPPINIDFVKEEFEKEGYTLLTKVYKNNKQRLNYICPKGHKSSVGWSNWKSGDRCPYCAGNARLTIEFIRSEFEKEGYTFLSIKYKRNRSKLEYICPEGHRHSITWMGWLSGRRCGVCKVFGGSGPQHGCWKGGISKEPYCQDWTKEYKEYIKQRDI